jgi:hypothetical protein
VALGLVLVAVFRALSSEPTGPAWLGDAFVIAAVIIVLSGWLEGWSGRRG